MKNKMIVFLVCVVILSLVAACAAPAAPTAAPAAPAATSAPAAPAAPAATSAPAAPAAATVKISFWSHDFPPREKLDRGFMEKFKADNPGVEIDYVLGPGDDVQYLTKLTTALAGGEGPDCFNLLNFSAGRLLAQGAVAPLDLSVLGFSSLDQLKSTYVEGTLNGLIQADKLYAMPSEVSNYAMFVNKKMFTDAGLSVEKDMPATWEAMLPLGKTLTKYDGSKITRRMFDFTYGQADDATSPAMSLAGMAYQLGGTIFNADGTQSMVNTEPWVKSLQFQQDWVVKEKLGDPSLTVGFLAFGDTSVGMFLGGSWYGPYLGDQKSAAADQFVVMPMPRWKDAVNKTGSFLYAYGLFVNSQSSPEKQLICTKLIKELSSHPEDYLKAGGLLQPTIALTNSATFKNTPFLNVFLEDMKGTPYWPTHPKSFEIADSLVRAVQRAVLDRAPVQGSLDQAKAEIDALLAQK